MADPKFANLPGIAYDQPDVYETPDVPEESTSDYYEDPETEVIERLHISSEDSYNKFKKKYLTGGNAVDYADKSGLNRYDVRAGCWELAALGEKETPIEKYRRIKCEMDELMREIVDMNTKMDISKEDKENYEAVSVVVNSAKKVLGSLRLENVLGTETAASTSEGEVKRLLSQVEDFQKRKIDSMVPKNPLASVDSSTKQLEQSKRLAELEIRLHKIETLIGASQQMADKLSRLASTMDTSGTLIDSVQHISTKAALLQPTQLDQIETRIAALATKLNAINEKCTSLGRNTDKDDKIQELYAIAKKTEPLAKILPNVLQRMETLEQLHNYANNFGKTIDELESTHAALAATLENNKMMLQKVQETFVTNLESVNLEKDKLEGRMKAAEMSRTYFH